MIPQGFPLWLAEVNDDGVIVTRPRLVIGWVREEGGQPSDPAAWEPVALGDLGGPGLTPYQVTKNYRIVEAPA